MKATLTPPPTFKKFLRLSRSWLRKEGRHEESGFRKLETIVRDQQAFEKAHGQSRRHEVLRLGVQATAIRPTAGNLLNQDMGELGVDVESGRDTVEEAADVDPRS